MDYIVANIRITLPDLLSEGHFRQALAPFSATGPGAEENDKAAADDKATGEGKATTAGKAIAAALTLRNGPCAPPAADYRELDRFEFSDADADCRFGTDSAGYLLEMTPCDGSPAATFRMSRTAQEVVTDYTPSRHLPSLLRFGLWTAYNIAAIEHLSVAIHSSVIVYRGQAILFLGESGTGKSTHTRLWREHIAGAELLNDDSPIVRGEAGTEAQACGSPWSGKTPCYRNESYPIRAFVRLSQAPHNRIRRLRAIEAIGALLPSCPPSFAHDKHLMDGVCTTLSTTLRHTEVYHLECLPDAAAARLVCETLFADETDR